MRYQFREDSDDAHLPRREAAEELAALIQMTRFMSDLIPRLVDDPQLARARLALLAATRQVIRNALAILGVGAPERMTRETDTA